VAARHSMIWQGQGEEYFLLRRMRRWYRGDPPLNSTTTLAGTFLVWSPFASHACVSCPDLCLSSIMAPVNADAPRNGDQAIEQILTLSGAGLALLGDQVTRQFLSTSLRWEDYLLLASGPLGVIPVAVSTIRIAGPEWLKNLIGR
jgi:hypothetical protein